MILIDPTAGPQFALRLSREQVRELRDALLEAHSSHKAKGEQATQQTIERLYEALRQQYKPYADLLKQVSALQENTP